jgi:lysozyme
MLMSRNGRKLLAQWEGMRNAVYDDAAGLPTIGVGHLLTQDELDSGTIEINGQAVEYRHGLSDRQVLDLLARDLVGFEKAVDKAVQVPLSQNQFDALVSFAFNVGTSAFDKSTLLKVLNQGQYDQVPGQMRRWVKAGGKTVDGLVNRREKEIALWNG